MVPLGLNKKFYGNGEKTWGRIFVTSGNKKIKDQVCVVSFRREKRKTEFIPVRVGHCWMDIFVILNCIMYVICMF